MDLKNGMTLGSWTVTGQMGNVQHVAWVRHQDGTEAVLKTPRNKRGEARFVQEALWMKKLRRTPGVLRLLDIDPSPNPRWFVVARAKGIQVYLGDTPNLREVVSLFHRIAETLVVLKGKRIAHRDIKPDNLFVVRRRAVVGDLGIAAFPNRPEYTRLGDRVGPASFQAPETRQAHPGLDAYAADVYSLAASLWACAAGEKYPPPGPLTATAEETSLYAAGGSSAYRLARLLEVCTAYRPRERPTMESLVEELAAWLDMHPEGSVKRPKPLTGSIRPGSWFMHTRSLTGSHDEIASRCVSRLRADAEQALVHMGDEDELDERHHAKLLGDYGPADPDWEPEWACDAQEVAWVEHPDRLVLAAYGHGDEVIYVAEWQQALPSGSVLRHVETDSARLHLPSDYSTRAELIQRIVSSAPSQP